MRRLVFERRVHPHKRIKQKKQAVQHGRLWFWVWVCATRGKCASDRAACCHGEVRLFTQRASELGTRSWVGYNCQACLPIACPKRSHKRGGRWFDTEFAFATRLPPPPPPPNAPPAVWRHGIVRWAACVWPTREVRVAYTVGMSHAACLWSCACGRGAFEFVSVSASLEWLCSTPTAVVGEHMRHACSFSLPVDGDVRGEHT